MSMSDGGVGDGGPAFPVQDASTWQGHGMTLRDYFAAKSIPMAAALEDSHPTYGEFPGYCGIAERAYLMADALLAARGSA
jgi:hypothetical protein